jgi:hypothetical protein
MEGRSSSLPTWSLKLYLMTVELVMSIWVAFCNGVRNFKSGNGLLEKGSACSQWPYSSAFQYVLDWIRSKKNCPWSMDAIGPFPKRRLVASRRTMSYFSLFKTFSKSNPKITVSFNCLHAVQLISRFQFPKMLSACMVSMGCIIPNYMIVCNHYIINHSASGKLKFSYKAVISTSYSWQ